MTGTELEPRSVRRSPAPTPSASRRCRRRREPTSSCSRSGSSRMSTALTTLCGPMGGSAAASSMPSKLPALICGAPRSTMCRPHSRRSGPNLTARRPRPQRSTPYVFHSQVAAVQKNRIMPAPKSQSPSIVGFLLPMSNTAFRHTSRCALSCGLTEISYDMLSDRDAKNAKIKRSANPIIKAIRP